MLPRGLKRGAWLELDDSDIRELVHAAGPSRDDMQPSSEAGNGGRPRSPREAPRRGGNRGTGDGRQNGQGRRNDRVGRGDRADGPNTDAQPDPMKTAFGYIGADSFTRQRQGAGAGQRRSGGGSGGGGGNRRGGRNR